jgi:hypothetical protein
MPRDQAGESLNDQFAHLLLGPCLFLLLQSRCRIVVQQLEKGVVNTFGCPAVPVHLVCYPLTEPSLQYVARPCNWRQLNPNP